MAEALASAPSNYKKVGFRIGLGLGKTELILSPECDPNTFLSRLEAVGGGLPHVVNGFSLCLGLPRHALNNSKFVTLALVGIGVHHNRLLYVVEDVTDEDPFAALRLLQECGVHCFGYIINSVTPRLVYDFAKASDEAVFSTLAAIQQEPHPQDSTHALPVGAGGASMTSLSRQATGSYMGAFF